MAVNNCQNVDCHHLSSYNIVLVEANSHVRSALRG